MLQISLAPEQVSRIGSFPITNAMLTGLVGSIIIVFLFGLAGQAVSLYPKSKLANVVEAISEALLDLIEQMTHNRAKAERFFPLLMTLFIFILVNNWLGLVPGVGSIIVHTTQGSAPLFRGANADLNATFALAVISVVMTQAYAIKQLGLFKHLKKYVSLNPIYLFIGLLEIISEFSRMISFSFRLFGNIFAGEVLLAVISSLLPLVGPLPFYGLELFVGFIQALVFTMLTLVFLEMATTSHDTHSSDHQPSHLPKNVDTLARS